MNTDDFDTRTLAAIVPLRQAGFALHYLHPRQKRPIGAEWQNAAPATLDDLRRSHAPGNNLGLRLGEPSHLITGTYAHVFDFDIRIAECKDEAWAAFSAVFPNVRVTDFPLVASGSGGESQHLHFTTSLPFRSKVLLHSEGKHRRRVGDKDVWSYDWEIELFGTGKQVALPPSVHPDTGREYSWVRPYDFNLLAMGIAPEIPADAIEAAGVAKDEVYAFESRDPLTFKDGQLESTLDAVPISDLHYDDWIKLGQALHHQFGAAQEGFDLWLLHTRRSAKYVKSYERDMRKKWRSFGKYRGAPVTMATIIEWSRAARVAALVDQFDEEPEVVPSDAKAPATSLAVGLDDMLGDPAPDPLGEADDFDDLTEAAKPDPATSWVSLLDVNEEGNFKPTLHNVELIVRHDPRLVGLPQLNEFTMEPVQRTPPGMKGKKRRNAAKEVRQLTGRVWNVSDKVNGDLWSDDRDYAIRSILEAPQTQGGYGLKITDRDLKAAIVLSASDSAFHPVREYLESTAWDGVPRVELLFTTYLGAPDDAYSRSVSRNMMLGAVTRIYEPGHKFDFAVILEGLQGKRKSTFIKVLGHNWFAELDGDFHKPKEMIELMQGAWIMEIPELSSFQRGEVRAIKGFISRQKDKARLAYAKRAGEFPRQCIFIGSTNDREYLKDDTGGRRFWPIECLLPEDQEIDTARLQRNIDQLWAEALHLYRAMRAEQPYGNLPLYLVDGAARSQAARLQELRRVESADDAQAAQIADWLEKPLNTGSLDEDVDADGNPLYRNEVCLKQIFVECLGNDARAYNQAAAQALGRSMVTVCKESDWSLSARKHSFKTWGKSRFYSRFGDAGYLARIGVETPE